MKILGVNGINSKGEGNTDKMLGALAALGYQVHDVNQPIRSALTARWCAKKDASDIVKAAQPGDVLLAHSYGCMKARWAMRQVNFRAVFLFRPAMSKGVEFPGWQDTKIYCIHSKGDLAIWAGSLLLLHPFGLAGVHGFKSQHVQNVQSTGRHNADFEADNLGNWASFIDSKIQALI